MRHLNITLRNASTYLTASNPYLLIPMRSIAIHQTHRTHRFFNLVIMIVVIMPAVIARNEIYIMSEDFMPILLGAILLMSSSYSFHASSSDFSGHKASVLTTAQ